MNVIPGTQPIGIKDSKRICVLRRRVGTRGLLEIEGVAHYLPVLRRLKMVIRFIPSGVNRGPAPLEIDSIEWANFNDVLGMRRALEDRMAKLEKAARMGEYPPVGMFFETCNSEEDPSFLERVCSKCQCPFCEISSASC